MYSFHSSISVLILLIFHMHFFLLRRSPTKMTSPITGSATSMLPLAALLRPPAVSSVAAPRRAMMSRREWTVMMMMRVRGIKHSFHPMETAIPNKIISTFKNPRVYCKCILVQAAEMQESPQPNNVHYNYGHQNKTCTRHDDH